MIINVFKAADILPACADLQSGDILEIPAGTYVNGLIGIKPGVNNITIRGLGAGAALSSVTLPGEVRPPTFAGKGWGAMVGKGICVVYGDDLTVENIAFTGASVSSQNGAGIRHFGRNITLKRCGFFGNQMGFLGAGDIEATEVIEGGSAWMEDCVFEKNGNPLSLCHNIYLGRYERGVFNRVTSTAVLKDGILLKSRARTNVLWDCVLRDNEGRGSYCVDLSGGIALIGGKKTVIQKGLNATNGSKAVYYSVFRDPDGPHEFVMHDATMECLLQYPGNFVRVENAMADGTLVPVAGSVDRNTMTYMPTFNKNTGKPDGLNYGHEPIRVPAGVAVGENLLVPFGSQPPAEVPFVLTPENVDELIASSRTLDTTAAMA